MTPSALRCKQVQCVVMKQVLNRHTGTEEGRYCFVWTADAAAASTARYALDKFSLNGFLLQVWIHSFLLMCVEVLYLDLMVLLFSTFLLHAGILDSFKVSVRNFECVFFIFSSCTIRSTLRENLRTRARVILPLSLHARASTLTPTPERGPSTIHLHVALLPRQRQQDCPPLLVLVLV